ncbi:MAG: hypothetical protein ACP5OB_08615, partial [Candidatus Ratteibacteria bacterium]
DIVIFSQDGTRMRTIEVKSLTERKDVPFGNNFNLLADFVIVCVNVFENPEIYIMRREDIKKNNITIERDGSCWLNINRCREFQNNWEIIGEGW